MVKNCKKVSKNAYTWEFVRFFENLVQRAAKYAAVSVKM